MVNFLKKFFVISIFFFSFFAINNAKAEVLNFSGLSNGALNNRAGWWERSSIWDVDGDHIKSNRYYNDYLGHSIATTTSGIIRIDLKKISNGGAYQQLDFGTIPEYLKGSTAPDGFSVRWDSSNNRWFIVGYASSLYFSDNTRTYIDYKFDCVAKIRQVSIDAGTFVDIKPIYGDPCNGLTNPIDYIIFQTENNQETYLYLVDTSYQTSAPYIASQQYILSDTRPDFYAADRDVCYFGQECIITMTYNRLAVGTVASFIWDNGQAQFPSNALFSYTLQNSLPYQQNFVLASTTQSIATTTPYSIYLKSDSGDILKSGFKIIWVDPATYELAINVATVCDDIQASDNTILGDTRYAFECASRKIFAWLFYPTKDSVKYMSQSVTKFENNFPVNIPFALINTVSSTIETSTTTGGNFGLPMFNDQNNTYYTEYGINQNTLSTTLGTSTTTLIKDEVSNFVWVITALVIAFIVIFFAIL